MTGGNVLVGHVSLTQLAAEKERESNLTSSYNGILTYNVQIEVVSQIGSHQMIRPEQN